MNNEIWLLLDSSSPGGIETHVFQLAIGLKEQGQKARVVFLQDYGPHPLRDALKASGVSTEALDGSMKSLWTMVRKHKPFLLHTHGYKAGILGRIIGLLAGVSAVSTFHAGEKPSGKLAIYDRLDRGTAWLAKKVFAVSPEIAARLPVKSLVLDNFIDTSRLPQSSGKQIAFVGRLSHEKGPDYFLQLATFFPKQQFDFYGDGPSREELEGKAGPNVRFHGQQSDMTPVWQKIGLLVMPSRHEGLPMAALEAMGRGIPVLASDVGALDQLVKHGFNGWLIPPGDTDALKAHLSQWLKMNNEDKNEFHDLSKAVVERRFSAAVVIPQLLSVYQDATARCM